MELAFTVRLTPLTSAAPLMVKLPEMSPDGPNVTVLALAHWLAVEALPFREAVIVPAEKLPEASRATTLLTVLEDVASTVQVVAEDPAYVFPVRYEPGVRSLRTTF
jgi:hypothetical protein